MSTNPGSAEAKRLGCSCPVLDNAYGKGAIKDGKISSGAFYTDPDCPIHRDRRLVDNGTLGGGEEAGRGDDGVPPATRDDLRASAAQESGAISEGQGSGVGDIQEDLGGRTHISRAGTETAP